MPRGPWEIPKQQLHWPCATQEATGGLLTVGRASALLCILPAAHSTLSGCSPGLPHLQLPLRLTGVSEPAQRLSPFPHQHSPHSRGKGYGLNWGTVTTGCLKYFVCCCYCWWWFLFVRLKYFELKGPPWNCTFKVNYAKQRLKLFQKSRRKIGRRF